MSKFLKIPNGDYKVEVQYGGRITLDTGDEVGQVVVTGDLLVQGNTTTIQSEDMVVRDNIIVVNDGEQGSGITLDVAGLKIDRGSLSNAYMVFDENLSYVDPITASTKNGAFTFRNELGSLVGLKVNNIGNSGAFYIETGSSAVSVIGTSYETHVVDDDHLPNKKYVDDAITTAFATVFLTQIGDGVVDPSTVKVLDNETTGNDSLVEIKIDNNVVAEFYGDRIDFGNLRITGSTIETITPSSDDIVLSARGSGTVRVNDVLHINSVPGEDDDDNPLLALEPAPPTDGIKLYVNNEGTGATGLYFVNADQRRDEIISNNRALVYSMIF